MDPSILFAGLHFDRRRFASDFDKFKKKADVEDELPDFVKVQEAFHGPSCLPLADKGSSESVELVSYPKEEDRNNQKMNKKTKKRKQTNKDEEETNFQDTPESTEKRMRRKKKQSAEANVEDTDESTGIKRRKRLDQLVNLRAADLFKPFCEDLESKEEVDKDKEKYHFDEEDEEAVIHVDSVQTKRKRSQKQQVNLSARDLFQPFNNDMNSKQQQEKTRNINDLKEQERKVEAKTVEASNLLRKRFRIHVCGHNIPPPLNSFEELRSLYSCKLYLLKNMENFGFREPTAVQRQVIPAMLSGRECFACAPTGSGKTLAFALPILMKLKSSREDGVRSVVLCPTRELAKQITLEFKLLSKGRKFRIRLMTKALSRCADFHHLPCDILVSTPLRLDYVLKQSRIDLSKVEYLVLDESDKLFELGFVEQIDSVVNACTNSQILRTLFSATLPDTVEELARSIMHDAVRIVVGEKNSASQTIEQKLLYVGTEEGKLLALRQIFQESLQPPILLFVQSKERAKELYKVLAFETIKVDCIHADLTEAQRGMAIEKFREGKTWVLIATDLLARGMDFKGVNSVINYDFPNTVASYIHRIGRCGRAGREGQAITIYTEDDVPFLRSIVNVIVASGGEVPSWMLSLPKQSRKKHNPRRDSIFSIPGRKSKNKNVKSVSKHSSKKPVIKG